MFAAADFRILQRQKRRLVALILVSIAILLAALAARFVLALNDTLSGPPHYMKAFANLMARQIANTTGKQYPVLAGQADNTDCRSVDGERASDYDDAYYVITFSEQARSVCLTVYGALPHESKIAGTTLSPGLWQNFGREFTTPVRVVPLHRSLTMLSPEYLALLHWRTKVDPATNVRAGTAQRVTNPSAGITFADTSLNLADIRAEVAKRHDLVNRVLLVLAICGSAVILLFLLAVDRVYRNSARQCSSFGFVLSLGTFLVRDLTDVAAEVGSEHERKRQEESARARVQHMLQREREDVARRLRRLLDSVQDEVERQRIQAALDYGDVAQGHAVLEELQSQMAQRTPEERLHLLLEPLKEYASEDELSEIEDQALAELRERGFRQARETVIRFHGQFRERYKKLIQEPVGE